MTALVVVTYVAVRNRRMVTKPVPAQLKSAAIPRIDLTPPRALIGKSTVEAIRSGVIFGFAAQVDAIVGRLREELGEETEAIATGGLAGAIVPFCDLIDDVDDMLTLTGLRLIHERNVDA